MALWGKIVREAIIDALEARLNEATAMTAGPKGSLGGIGKKPSTPAPGDMKRTTNAPKGTARHHADMAAKHQQSAQHHERRASEHEDEGNDDKAEHHYDKMQHHDDAADAHRHAQDMIKKHGSDHPEAQKASKEANKHKLGESVELDEISPELAKRAFDARAKKHAKASASAKQWDRQRAKDSAKGDNRGASAAYSIARDKEAEANRMVSKLDRSAKKAGVDGQKQYAKASARYRKLS
jgi:hypothetical protein